MSMAAYEAVPVHEPVAEQVIVKSTGSPSRESGSVTVEGSSSGDNVFQVAQDWVISRAKPLLEFLDSRRINLPPLSEIAERVKKNIDRYFYNYTIVATGAFALQAISHPIQTVLFGLVAYFWSYKLYKNGNSSSSRPTNTQPSSALSKVCETYRVFHCSQTKKFSLALSPSLPVPFSGSFRC